MLFAVCFVIHALQNIVLNDGTVLPLTYCLGVCGLDISTPSSEDLDSRHVVELTCSEVHQPEVLEHDGVEDPTWDSFRDPSLGATIRLYWILLNGLPTSRLLTGY